MSAPPLADKLALPRGSAFLAGLRAGASSVFMVVIVGSYVSIGALAHDLGFPLLWVVLSSLLIWAAPAQLILISAVGTGGPPLEVALAVGLSGMRLLPMVVALMPLLKTPATRLRGLLLPAHFTAISMWVECLRLLPGLRREARIAFANGLGLALMTGAVLASIVGFRLAQELPSLLVAALLFLSPMSFLISAVRNASMTVDRVALVLGLVLAPLLAWRGVELDLMWTGLIGGGIAYAAHRIGEALR